MRTSNKITLIAGLSAIALIGTGYAAWTFSADATAEAEGNVNITAKAEEVGTLKVADGQSFYLTLDQDSIKWMNSADATTATEVTTIKLEYSGSQASDYKSGKAVEETIVVKMELGSNELSEYVTLGDMAADQEKTYKGEDKIEIDFTLPTASYVEANYPRNETAYDTMKAALDGKKITLNFTASVKECTHA